VCDGQEVDAVTTRLIERGRPTRILLADDHQIIRDGLRALLETEGFTVVGEASNGREAVRLTQALRPAVSVLDVTMPQLNGLGAARAIRQASPTTKTVLLSMHAQDRDVSEALKAGVRGYVLYSQASADLVQAIREVARGMTYLSPGVSRAVVDAYLATTNLSSGPTYHCASGRSFRWSLKARRQRSSPSCSGSVSRLRSRHRPAC
jgi:DNA-binding NarL/FixJ family response regulator